MQNHRVNTDAPMAAGRDNAKRVGKGAIALLALGAPFVAATPATAQGNGNGHGHANAGADASATAAPQSDDAGTPGAAPAAPSAAPAAPSAAPAAPSAAPAAEAGADADATLNGNGPGNTHVNVPRPTRLRSMARRRTARP